MPANGPVHRDIAQDSAARRLRLLAIVACALALGLAGWRTFDIMTKPASATLTGTAYEQELVSLIEPVAGSGHVRLNLHRSETGARTFLILIDGPEIRQNPHAIRIETLLASAAGFNAANGDRLDIQQFPFASGVSARPSEAELAELAGLGLLALLLGYMAFMPERTRLTAPTQTARPETEQSAPRLRRMLPDASTLETPTHTRRATSEAARDPAAAAAVVRKWMRDGENVA